MGEMKTAHKILVGKSDHSGDLRIDRRKINGS
jgi:hypothetical protein